jgi:hypothetical protein
VDEINKEGGWVADDSTRLVLLPSGRWEGGGLWSVPEWLRNILGDDFFTEVVKVSLDGTHVADAMLGHLAGLDKLEQLGLSETPITEAALAHLEGLPRLQKLDLRNTGISDAGLAHLEGLKQLQELWLGGTQVTDEGVNKLQQALPDCQIVQ